jgi:hypothetical protein
MFNNLSKLILRTPSQDITQAIAQCLKYTYTQKNFHRVSNKYSVFKHDKIDRYLSFNTNFLLDCEYYNSIQNEVDKHEVKIRVDNFYTTSTKKGFDVFYDIKNKVINIRV